MNDAVLRSLTGSVYVIVLIFAISFDFWSLVVLFAFFLIQGQHELRRMFERIGGYHPLGALTMAVVTFTSAAVYQMADPSYSMLLLALIPLAMFRFLGGEVLRSKATIQRTANTFLGGFYLSVPLSVGLMLTMMEGNYNGMLLLSIFICLWSNDTLAYVSGRLLGEKKLLPRLSPNKTVEGFVGGMIGTLIVALVLHHYVGLGMNEYGWLGFGLIVSFSGTIGDLFESMLKRAAEVKDSGKIIPGHGGVLDRIDSFLFAVPFIYFYRLLLDLI